MRELEEGKMRLTGKALYVVAAVLGISNAGSDHLFHGKRAEFSPEDAKRLIGSRFMNSTDDAVFSITRSICETESILEMFREEARDWEKRLGKMDTFEMHRTWSRYSAIIRAVGGE